MRDAPTSNLRAWTVVAAALGLNLVLGLLYAWGVLAKALVTDPAWHWTTAQASLPFTVATVCFAIMMIPAGRLQDRINPRFVAVTGGLLLGAGLVATSFAQTPAAIAITFGGLGGVGIGLGYSATTPPAVKWFPATRKGLITGLVVSGVGVAAVYISPLTHYLLAATGSISRTFLVLGLGAAALSSVLAQFIVNPPADYAPPAAEPGSLPEAHAAAKTPDLDWREMLRTPQFYQLWVMFVLGTSAGLMIISQIAIIAQEQAHWDWGFVPVATLALFNTVGRILGGFLSDRIGRRRTMILAFVAQAINLFAFMRYASPALLVFGAAFTGLCYGALFALFPATVADYYGLRNLGVNYGWAFTGFGAAGVLGPIVAAHLHDHYHTYAYSYGISAVMLLVGALLGYALRPPKAGRECEDPLARMER